MHPLEPRLDGGRADPQATLDQIHTWAVEAFYEAMPELAKDRAEWIELPRLTLGPQE